MTKIKYNPPFSLTTKAALVSSAHHEKSDDGLKGGSVFVVRLPSKAEDGKEGER